MAEQSGKFLRGAIGGYVFRVVNNKQQVSQKPLPGTMKQTKETKRAAATFGMASSLGAQIRATISSEINRFPDEFLTNRLNSGLIRILNECRNPSTKLFHFEDNSFSSLKDLEYNVNSKVNRWMLIRPQISLEGGNLIVEIPELVIPTQLKFPAKTFHCRINVYVSLFRLKDGLVSKFPDLQQVTVTREKESIPAQKLVFEVADGCLCVVSLFMQYSVAGNFDWEPINNKMFNPGCICGALSTPGIYQDKKRRTWLPCIQFDM